MKKSASAPCLHTKRLVYVQSLPDMNTVMHNVIETVAFVPVNKIIACSLYDPSIFDNTKDFALCIETPLDKTDLPRIISDDFYLLVKKQKQKQKTIT
jgi:hypothetical protein